MRVDYKKELEIAAKSMIMVHDSEVLIKMIVRMIVQKVKVNHAGILLFDVEKDAYVLNVSRGALGLRIPAGFARVDKNNPLIRFFTERWDRILGIEGMIVLQDAKKILRKKNIPTMGKKILEGALLELDIFESVACISSYFRNDLLGLLLLGTKRNKKDFTTDELTFFSALASDVAMAIRNAQLFTNLEDELNKKHRLFLHTTIALAAAIDAKDHYTHGHTARVTSLSLRLAQKLGQILKKEFAPNFLEHLHIASLLHDIGKIGIPESILNKDGPLDPDEQRKMREHTILGTTILQPIRELSEAIQGVKYHHEHYDGSGYPEGLKGEQIPLVASIIAVADSFDAMTTDRPYRKGLDKDKAVEEIKRCSNTQFNPIVADAFIELFKEGEV